MHSLLDHGGGLNLTASLVSPWCLENSIPNHSPMFTLGNAIIVSKAAESWFKTDENRMYAPQPPPVASSWCTTSGAQPHFQKFLSLSWAWLWKPVTLQVME